MPRAADLPQEPLPDDEAAAPAPKRRPVSGSLGRRLFLLTLAFCVVFSLAAVLARTLLAWHSHRRSMEADLTLLDQVFQRTMTKALWEVDREMLRAQLAGASEVASVGLVEVQIHQNGKPPEVLSVRRPGLEISAHAPAVTRELTYEPYPGGKETVGTLRLVGDERVLWQRLRKDAAVIATTQVVQSVLLAMLVMWMFHRLVTVHVRHIARHLSQLTPATLQRRLRLRRPATRRDELTLLETGVNDLQSNLSEHLARQKRDEAELSANRDRLAELVDEQTRELRAANDRLEELTRSDPLTGLANRRHFDELKEVEFRRAQRLGHPLTVLMCDLDHFKRYNDAYGHAQGDRCLQQVAEVLREGFARAGELVARLGGEEFVVLLPGTDRKQARVIAERLRHTLHRLGLPHGDSPSGIVTISVGLAQFDPGTMSDFNALLHEADQALYRAKSQGRDRIAD